MRRFEGQNALVTGAAQGIGEAVATRLAREGAQVTVIDRNQQALAAALERIQTAADATVHGECLDVTDGGQVTSVLDRVNASPSGSIDVLVNNAGIIRDGWIDDMEDEAWDAVLRVNLTGAFHCCRAVAPVMKAKDYGRIVNITSRAWLGNPGQCNYSASKAGLVGLTRSLALELARFGITVNAVAPALIDTPMIRALDPPVRERLIAAQPTKRMGTVEDVASAVAFFSTREASFITGQVLNVCGGKSVGTGGIS